MVEKKPGFFHRHTLQGRREEYVKKYDYLRAESQGVTRYALEQKLEADADRYAKRKVAMDLIGIAVVAGTSVFVVKELRKGTLEETLLILSDRIVELGENAVELVREAARGAKNAADHALQHIGTQVGDGMGKGLMPHVEQALSAAEESSAVIGRNAVEGALSSVIPALPMAGTMLESQAGVAGAKFGEGLAASLRQQIPDLVQAFASQLRFPGVLFRKPTGK